MGDRVWGVQKELEELQQRSLSGPQVQSQCTHHVLLRAICFSILYGYASKLELSFLFKY